VSRVCLDMLRTRTSRREDPLEVHVPDPIVRAIGRGEEGPETDAMLADSVGLALLVVLEKLEPAERLAFVLHDVFGMTFEEIAPVVDRSVVATRQLASRARRRVGSGADLGRGPAEAAPRRRRVSRGRPGRRLRSAGRCPRSGDCAAS
jgi:DNA-directed RNA polymerase specialized sigma24 family protein